MTDQTEKQYSIYHIPLDKVVVCPLCGEAEAHIVLRPKVFGTGSDMTVIESVPVISCRNCGRDSLAPETEQRIAQLLADPNVGEVRDVYVTRYVSRVPDDD